MAAANVDLIEMRHSAVAGSHCDVFKLHIHVVFGCRERERDEVRLDRSENRDTGEIDRESERAKK
jgi:hypothetical protein